MNNRAFITARKAQYAVSTLCRLLEVSWGWFYGLRASQLTRDQRQADREALDEKFSPKSKSFSKPVRSVTGPSVFIRTCWQMMRLSLNGVWLE